MFQEKYLYLIWCRFCREPEWSSDEKLCGMLLNNEAVFFEDANFSKPAHRFSSGKIDYISISPGEAPYHVLCYMPGKHNFDSRYVNIL